MTTVKRELQQQEESKRAYYASKAPTTAMDRARTALGNKDAAALSTDCAETEWSATAAKDGFVAMELDEEEEDADAGVKKEDEEEEDGVAAGSLLLMGPE